MIAIPLDNKESTVISKLYGNSAYFALLNEETGAFKVLKNTACGEGMEADEFITALKVDNKSFNYMGEKVYDNLKEKGLRVYSCLKTHLSIDEIYQNLLKNKCKEVTKENSSELLDSGNSACTCKTK